MKVIYSGLEGSGKSLKIAQVIQKLVVRNSRWGKICGKERPIYSNMNFSDQFEDHARSIGVPIYHWQNLDELMKVSDADVIIDEVGNYFDSRMWADLSLDCRRWLTQGSKTGVEIYGTAQDFAQIDKSFRRLVNQLHHIRKIFGSRRPSATKPPIKNIWGLCMLFALDPQGYDEDNKQPLSKIPSGLLWIKKKDCDIFDTGQKIGRSAYPALRHEERFCQHHEKIGGDNSCRFCKVFHI